MASVLGARPLSFAEPQNGMAVLAKSFFEEGLRLGSATAPAMKDLLPSGDAVKSNITRLALKVRDRDVKNVLPKALKYGDGLCCDGLKKKRTVSKLYDVSIQYVELDESVIQLST